MTDSYKVIPGLKYTAEHEWMKPDGTVGITDFAQHELGDVVFVDLPTVGVKVTAGKPFGSVESVKAVSDLFAPVNGTVAAVNGTLNNDPAIVNKDPYGAGWLIRITLADPAELDKLMTDEAYKGRTAG
jgi:glycine cleavage system H protein